MSYPTMPTPKAPDPAVVVLEQERRALADQAAELRTGIEQKQTAVTEMRARLETALQGMGRLSEAIRTLEATPPPMVSRDE